MGLYKPLRRGRGHSQAAGKEKINEQAMMEFNTKLETALGVESAIAENLREEIYATIAELNKLTATSNAPDDRGRDFVPRNNDEQSHVQPLNESMSQMSVDEIVDEQVVLTNHDKVQVSCFPTNRKGVVEPVQVPAAMLAYLNHAELLRKYGSI
jgi:hypothetical protein